MYYTNFSKEKPRVSRKTFWIAILISFLIGYLLYSRLFHQSPSLTQSVVEVFNNFIFNNINQDESCFFHLQPQCDNIDTKYKYDCNPDEPIDEQVCVSRGCCWRPEAYADGERLN